jgi:NTE family protein
MNMDSKPIGLCLSGGGSRAIAFHLGCFRALNKRGLLDRINVISAVSGGSIIGAMYAYSRDSFQEFDVRVVELLKRGLLIGIAKQLFLSPILFKCIATALTAWVLCVPCRVLGRSPMRRWASRTDALVRILDQWVFQDLRLNSQRRGGLEIVINACELRTGSAFRFGSMESGC